MIKTWRSCKLIGKRLWKVRSRRRRQTKGRERKSRISTGSRKTSPMVTGWRIIGIRTIPRKEPTRCITCRSLRGNRTPRKARRSKSLATRTTANPRAHPTQPAQIPRKPKRLKSLATPTTPSPAAPTTQPLQTPNPPNPTTA